jgi:hypothetical protein
LKKRDSAAAPQWSATGWCRPFEQAQYPLVMATPRQIATLARRLTSVVVCSWSIDEASNPRAPASRCLSRRFVRCDFGVDDRLLVDRDPIAVRNHGGSRFRPVAVERNDGRRPPGLPADARASAAPAQVGKISGLESPAPVRTTGEHPLSTSTPEVPFVTSVLNCTWMPGIAPREHLAAHRLLRIQEIVVRIASCDAGRRAARATTVRRAAPQRARLIERERPQADAAGFSVAVRRWVLRRVCTPPQPVRSEDRRRAR